MAISTGVAANSSAPGDDVSLASLTGTVSLSSVDTAGIGSATLSALICDSDADVVVGISSGGCSTAADASTSNNGALTDVTT